MGLPAKYREVVLLRYYEGLKLKEIAGALRLSDGKVRSRLNRANALLRDRLKEWYYDEET
jgi:RNA polymerase sigma-70 factor (ECF subfamily)